MPPHGLNATLVREDASHEGKFARCFDLLGCASFVPRSIRLVTIIVINLNLKSSIRCCAIDPGQSKHELHVSSQQSKAWLLGRYTLSGSGGVGKDNGRQDGVSCGLPTWFNIEVERRSSRRPWRDTINIVRKRDK